MNIAQLFINYALKNPNKPAFVVPEKYDQDSVTEEKIYSYSDFYKLVSQYRVGLVSAGFKKGDRIILLTPLDIEFYAFMMAMISLGVVAVFLDPGIGIKKLIVAIQDSGAKAVISIDRFFKYRFLIPQLWSKKLYSRDTKGILLTDFSVLKSKETQAYEATHLEERDHLLITFTSGSTGRSKGSDRNAANVYNQINAIKDSWACSENEIDFPTFPMFGFMNLCFGITTVLPPLDFRRVGDISPKCVVSQMKKWKVTRMSGSATFLSKVSNYLVENGLQVETMRNCAMGGAPVTKEFCQKLNSAFPNSVNVITYGSTEVAPISFIEMNKVLDSKGHGALVGRVCEGLTASVVQLPVDLSVFDEKEDGPFKVKKNEWGEVIVKGPHVVQSYVDNPLAGLKNKIMTQNGEVWHRTGDIGHFDDDGHLWLTGRLSELVEHKGRTFRPYIIEGEVNTATGVHKSALLNGKNRPVLVIEPYEGQVYDSQVIHALLKELGLEEYDLRQVKKIPLDDRHNSKIDRIRLAKSIEGKFWPFN